MVRYKKKNSSILQLLVPFLILAVLSLTILAVNQKTHLLGRAQTNKSSPLKSSTPGEYFTVQVGPESFVFYTTNQQTIRDARRAYDQRLPLFPNGKLQKGREDYNPSWSWHYDYQDVRMVEASIELCDGLPSDVENNLDYWLKIVGRFCPWAGRIVKVGLSPTPTVTPTPIPTSFTGVIQKLEASIYQQGTHLLQGGSSSGIVLLQSRVYNLNKYLGKKAKVRGKISPLVGGGGVLVEVTWLRLTR